MNTTPMTPLEARDVLRAIWTNPHTCRSLTADEYARVSATYARLHPNRMSDALTQVLRVAGWDGPIDSVTHAGAWKEVRAILAVIDPHDARDPMDARATRP